MKPRHREISIFNLSMLDVIFGAMGAFIILMIVLLPYYGKRYTPADVEEALRQAQEAQAQAEKMRQMAEAARRRVEETQQELQRTQAALRQAQERLAKTFLVVTLRWTTDDQDVDLHVINPAGREFYFEQKTHPGQPGRLSEDDTSGPGYEVWEIREAPPGPYRIYANLYDRSDNPDNPTIAGRTYYRDGSKPFPETRLSQEGEKKLILIATVTAEGSVQFQFQ